MTNAHQTSRLRPGRPDYAILATTLALVVIGLIFVYSASFAIALDAFDDANYFLIRQMASALIGLAVMFFLMRIDYRLLRLASPALMLFAVLSLAAVLFVGNDAYGARRWISMGPLPPFQPSEFAKLALIIYIAAWLASRGRDVQSFALGFAPFIFLVGVVAALILMEPDTGTASIVVMTTAALFFIAGASLTHLFALVGIAAVTFGMLILGGGYRSDRIFAFIRAEDDPAGVGFHTLQLLIALGSGGIEGLGLGVSRQKFFYIPGAHTDGVFAIIGEETGFIGAIVVIGLFAYLVYRGFRVAMNSRDDFGCYLAIGIVSWIAFQGLINVGGITRSIPLTGIPLPFVSYGGTSLVMLMAAIGILLNVSRYGKDRSFAERPQAQRVAPKPTRRSNPTRQGESPARGPA
ncbi:MAG: putative lipid II flippase FtsW [Dehalococcoidia bacterium]|nr:putative lipid II flippase FtsW [Dehalococcoidia bacterium]